MCEYIKQELLPREVRSDILKKIMMLKSWFLENMNIELSWLEYSYISEALIMQTGLPYSNRDLFDIQIWANKVPVYPGYLYRKECNFDLEIIKFMNSIGLNWDYWCTQLKK
jgi:hypothetical protein